MNTHLLYYCVAFEMQGFTENSFCKERGKEVFGLTDLALKIAWITDSCNKLNQLADFQNCVSAVIFNGDSGLSLSYVRS